MSNPYYFNPFFDAPEPEPILREAFSGWDEGNGIFSALSKVGQLPWRGIESISDASLDIEYFGNHSGGKFCAPIVKHFIKDGSVPEAQRESIASILISKYLFNWQRLWDTNVIAYEPIYNYNMYETRNLVRSEDESRTTEGENKQTGTDTLTHGRIESTDKTNTQVLAREQENDSTENRTDTTEHGKTETVERSSTEDKTTDKTVTLVKDGTSEVTHGKTETVEHNTTETITHGKTSTLTKDDTETTTHGRTNDELTSRYGLNTEGTPKPSDDVKTTEGGTTKVTTAGTDTTNEGGTTETATEGTDKTTDGGTTLTTDKGTDTTHESGTENNTISGTDTTTEGGTTKLTSEDTAKETEKENSTNAETGTTKVTTSGDDVTTKDLTDTNSVKETRDNDGMESESTHRYGNIGVTTSQKMLADEREVWMWNFFDQVFADLDKELTLAFHDPCRV